jgi:CheY-like chemotaxis protein
MFITKTTIQKYCFYRINDPADVISKYNNHHRTMYDLLVIDILMPRMNGFELYEKIKKNR